MKFLISWAAHFSSFCGAHFIAFRRRTTMEERRKALGNTSMSRSFVIWSVVLTFRMLPWGGIRRLSIVSDRFDFACSYEKQKSDMQYQIDFSFFMYSTNGCFRWEGGTSPQSWLCHCLLAKKDLKFNITNADNKKFLLSSVVLAKPLFSIFSVVLSTVLCGACSSKP